MTRLHGHWDGDRPDPDRPLTPRAALRLSGLGVALMVLAALLSMNSEPILDEPVPTEQADQ